MAVPSPGLSTMKRQNRELLSQFKLDDDDDDDDEPNVPYTPTKASHTKTIGSTRVAPVRKQQTSPLKSTAIVGITEENISGLNMEQLGTTSSTPFTSPPKFALPSPPAASAPVQSPGLGTFRRQAAALVFPDDEDENEHNVPLSVASKSGVKVRNSSDSTVYTVSDGSFPDTPKQWISPVPMYDTVSMSAGRMRAAPATPPRILKRRTR
jgi:hypothetical protein